MISGWLNYLLCATFAFFFPSLCRWFCLGYLGFCLGCPDHCVALSWAQKHSVVSYQTRGPSPSSQSIRFVLPRAFWRIGVGCFCDALSCSSLDIKGATPLQILFRIGWPQFVPECLHLFRFGNDNPLHLCSFLRFPFYRIFDGVLCSLCLQSRASFSDLVGSVQVSGSNNTCKSVCLFGSWLMHFSKFLELPGVELSFPWKTIICSENCI